MTQDAVCTTRMSVICLGLLMFVYFRPLSSWLSMSVSLSTHTINLVGVIAWVLHDPRGVQ